MADRSERVAVIADEIVSVRPLNETELFVLQGLTRSHLSRGLVYIVLASCGLAAVLVVQLLGTMPHLVLVTLVLGNALLVGLARWLPRLRRGWRLRRDRALGKMLVLESPRGRCERLAASGLLWRRGDTIAAWRSEG